MASSTTIPVTSGTWKTSSPCAPPGWPLKTWNSSIGVPGSMGLDCSTSGELCISIAIVSGLLRREFERRGADRDGLLRPQLLLGADVRLKVLGHARHPDPPHPPPASPLPPHALHP